MRRRDLLGGAAAMTAAGCAGVGLSEGPDQTVWTFDNLDRIGGLTPSVEGAPRLIDSPHGQATLFDGMDDALFLPSHPLAGAERFTFEAIFRPDGGAHEQRWLHLQEDPAGPNAPSGGTRFLFEIRVEGHQWWLDAFAKGPDYNHTLIFPDKRFPVGRWFHVAQSYDGRMYRSYVDGALQGEAEISFTPQGPGVASVGCRINRVNHFHGAVREARFTPAFLPPERFSRG